MRIVLLRHGKTRGNEEHRYVGRTDEPLTAAARETILGSRTEFWRDVLHLKPQRAAESIEDLPIKEGTDESGNLNEQSPLSCVTIWVSPLQRARETAALLCPGLPQRIIPDFREMDFGRFEYRNYAELMADPASAGCYQSFIDSGGTSAFPEGECRADFSSRVCRAYEHLLPELFVKGTEAEDDGSLDSRETMEGAECVGAEKTLLIVTHGGTLMALLERFGLPKADYFHWQCACLAGFSGELAADGGISGISGCRVGGEKGGRG